MKSSADYAGGAPTGNSGGDMDKERSSQSETIDAESVVSPVAEYGEAGRPLHHLDEGSDAPPSGESSDLSQDYLIHPSRMILARFIEEKLAPEHIYCKRYAGRSFYQA